MRQPDLYVTLGVERHASTAEVKRAYFRRAQHEHPDKGGDLASWQYVSDAYSTLVDADRRMAYDKACAGVDLLEVFRGADVEETIRVPFLTGLRGGYVVHNGRKLRIRARAGAVPTVSGGLGIRVRGGGAVGFPPGDLLLAVHVDPHSHVKIDESHALGLRMWLPVTLLECYQGGPLPVPTPWGTFYLRFTPGGLAHGEEIICRGYGVRCDCPAVPRCSCEHGDLRVVIELKLPASDAALSHVLERLQGGCSVRAGLERALKEE